MSKVAVIYLERVNNYPSLEKTFTSSMLENEAGSEFDYIHVLKGTNGVDKIPCMDTTYINIKDSGHALHSLREVLKKVHNDKFLFFTSYSKILKPLWLLHYINVFKNVKNCGIVGATGNYEINRHIRTNAFMMDRILFLNVADGNLESKADECNLEHGNDNLTSQIINRGLVPAVVDKDGKTWMIDDWQKSGTFRSGDQASLLVSDNRTMDYDLSDEERKRYLRNLSWGSV